MSGADVNAAFEAIDWSSIDFGAVAAFYAQTGRPVSEQVILLVGPMALAARPEWRRRVLEDLAAMQKRACPGCAA